MRPYWPQEAVLFPFGITPVLGWPPLPEIIEQAHFDLIEQGHFEIIEQAYFCYGARPFCWRGAMEQSHFAGHVI
jgi:hypothetical protein